MLDGLCGGKEFIWHWIQAHGRSGGILVWVNLDKLDVGSIEEGNFL